ncbi:MAG: pentapeptide repeat-containing protein [Jatrophihabitantaceae bacterium]
MLTADCGNCFGAGQQVSQLTFGGHDWRSAPHTAVQMFAVFPIMRALHELLYYLQGALDLVPEGAVHDALATVSADVERQTRTAPEALLAIDVAISRDDVNPLLLQASEFVRAGRPAHTVDHRGVDLIGADLRGTDLRWADVTGADLRAADLRGADLRDALFLAQSQLDAAKGDADTMLSDGLARPSHWSRSRFRTAAVRRRAAADRIRA